MATDERLDLFARPVAGRRLSRRVAVSAATGLAASAAFRPAAAQDATQSAAPMAAAMTGFDVFVVGFHCGKEHPEMQSEAHHFCKQLPSGLFQCAIFDGDAMDAKLMGVEYIVSEEVFLALPEDEQLYWHPHNYEIFSGQLVAPTMDDDAELEMMRTTLLNSYGKTWHAWHTDRPDGRGQPGDPVPMGPAKLQWSFNRDGEADESLVQSRNERLGIDAEAKRQARQEFAAEAQPQEGVNAIADAFPNSTPEPPPGVIDVIDARAIGTPTP